MLYCKVVARKHIMEKMSVNYGLNNTLKIEKMLKINFSFMTFFMEKIYVHILSRTYRVKNMICLFYFALKIKASSNLALQELQHHIDTRVLQYILEVLDQIKINTSKMYHHIHKNPRVKGI